MSDRSCAVRDFSDSLKRNPTNAQAYLNRGIAYHQLGHEQAAIADLQKAVEYFAQQGETQTSEKFTATTSFLSEIVLVECGGSFEIKPVCLYYL